MSVGGLVCGVWHGVTLRCASDLIHWCGVHTDDDLDHPKLPVGQPASRLAQYLMLPGYMAAARVA
jgi:hypothetical protein